MSSYAGWTIPLGLSRKSGITSYRILCDAMRIYSSNDMEFPVAIDPSIESDPNNPIPDAVASKNPAQTIRENHARSGDKVGAYQARADTHLVDFINCALAANSEDRLKAKALLDHEFLSDPLYDNEEQIQHFLTHFMASKS